MALPFCAGQEHKVLGHLRPVSDTLQSQFCSYHRSCTVPDEDRLSHVVKDPKPPLRRLEIRAPDRKCPSVKEDHNGKRRGLEGADTFGNRYCDQRCRAFDLCLCATC